MTNERRGSLKQLVLRNVVRALAAASVLAPCASATADPAPLPDTSRAPASSPDVRAEIPNLTYAYAAYGVSTRAFGVQTSGSGLGGRGQRASIGGGGTVWGSPIDRLTLVVDAQRDVLGNFAPSLAAVVRIYGGTEGLSLGLLGKFKVDGFGVGPAHEMESETEAGLLASYARYGWHLDANAIGGFGNGDDGEIDAEARARVGRDLGAFVRVGVDGQARFRLAGDKPLAGNRTWDFAGGPQVLLGSSHFFGAVTGGPATMGIVDKLGWTAVLTLGGTTL